MADNQDNMPLTPPKEKKTWKKGSKQFEIYNNMRNGGSSIQEAGAVANFNKNYAYNAEQKRKKLSLSNPKLLKKANKFIHQVLDNAKAGDKAYINPATIFTRDIYDRVEPKVNKIEQDTRSVSVEIKAESREAIVDMIRQFAPNLLPNLTPQVEANRDKQGVIEGDNEDNKPPNSRDMSDAE